MSGRVQHVDDRHRHHPPPKDERTRRRMQQQRRQDTKPEVALRKELHSRGMRYRLHQRPIAAVRRTVDVVFRGVGVAVEIRGCFWHACPEHGSTPQSNRDWWAAKLSKTVARDRETKLLLEEAGWLLLVVWEHEDVSSAADRVEAAVRSRRRALSE